LFPSLYRWEQDGKLKAEWRATENNRRAKYYRLPLGAGSSNSIESAGTISFAVTSVLEGA